MNPQFQGNTYQITVFNQWRIQGGRQGFCQNISLRPHLWDLHPRLAKATAY